MGLPLMTSRRGVKDFEQQYKSLSTKNQEDECRGLSESIQNYVASFMDDSTGNKSKLISPINLLDYFICHRLLSHIAGPITAGFCLHFYIGKEIQMSCDL